MATALLQRRRRTRTRRRRRFRLRRRLLLPLTVLFRLLPILLVGGASVLAASASAMDASTAAFVCEPDRLLSRLAGAGRRRRRRDV